jgi:hypothetical protein
MSYQRYPQNNRGQVNPWQNGGGIGGLLPHPGVGVDPLALVGNLVGAMLTGQQVMGGQQMALGPQMGMSRQVSIITKVTVPKLFLGQKLFLKITPMFLRYSA